MSLPNAWALRGQQLIQQILDAPNEAAKRVLAAELQAHLMGGAKAVPVVDYKAAAAGEDAE